MNRDEWRPWPKRWSEEWITAHDPEKDRPLDPEVVRDGWLGYRPASPDEIATLEARLGLTLPPSLRGFLETTNGWRDAGHFIHRLGGTSDIGFLRDMRPTLIEAYDEVYGDEPEMENDVSPLLRRSVKISLDGDSCDLFLDPEDADSHGEWAAYKLASWSGMGPVRQHSFGHLMRRLYESFRGLR
ncbi:SMI1/KNR4 family protein [Actinomadura algeriensis]|uniref:Knr4/Smi1-like domain-containing protein n=1 Tax=Actinomadura algeriensis TaxID=1679523 RepID=A0ABR9JZI5_9ACTN|nr:SMI1/KNR4 family protein [Actinomadura algeriensis]MBE1535986.1 hypothetical protein [Actinomadura algeriensis]